MSLSKRIIRKTMPKFIVKQIVKAYRTLNQIKSYIYIGNTVYCPCCDKYFSRFLDFKIDLDYNNPENYKETAASTVCPFCRSLPRHRMICAWLDTQVSSMKNKKVLIFAPEYSVLLYLNRKNLICVTADLFAKDVDLVIDIQAIDLPNNSYDYILCNHVLQHVPNDQVALKELKRILNVGGKIEITVCQDFSLGSTIFSKDIISKEDKMKIYGQPDYCRLYGGDFEQIMQKSGFKVDIFSEELCPNNIGAKQGPSSLDSPNIYIGTNINV